MSGANRVNVTNANKVLIFECSIQALKIAVNTIEDFQKNDVSKYLTEKDYTDGNKDNKIIEVVRDSIKDAKFDLDYLLNSFK
jgi:hypothetical protein